MHWEITLVLMREIPLQLFKCTLVATTARPLRLVTSSFVDFSNETDSVTDLRAASKYQKYLSLHKIY